MKQKYNCLLVVKKFHNKKINWLLLVRWLDLLPEIHIRKSQIFPTVIKLTYTVRISGKPSRISPYYITHTNVLHRSQINHDKFVSACKNTLQCQYDNEAKFSSWSHKTIGIPALRSVWIPWQTTLPLEAPNNWFKISSKV
jgi:hypothetical protein